MKRFSAVLLALAIFASCSARAEMSAPGLANGVSPPPAPQSPGVPYTGVDIPTREYAARKGSYYVFTTGSAGNFLKGGLAVTNGQFLNARICNVSATQTAYITERIFDTDGAVAVPYGGIASPAALTSAMTSAYTGTPTNGSNVIVGSTVSTALQMTFGVGTAAVNNATGNATPTGVGYAYPGTKNELHELRILPPGTCFGQYVDGPSSSLGTTTYYLQFRFYAYVE